MVTLDFQITVEWTTGGANGSGWSKTVDGDVDMPTGSTTKEIQDFIYENVTEGHPEGGRITRYELCGKVLLDVPSYLAC